MHARLLGRAGAGPARLQSFFQQPCRACVRSAAAAHISGALSATVSSALPSLLLTLGHQPCAAARNGWAPGQAPTPRCCSAPEEIAACVGRHPRGLARVSSALPQARGGVGSLSALGAPALPCPAQPSQPNPTPCRLARGQQSFASHARPRHQVPQQPPRQVPPCTSMPCLNKAAWPDGCRTGAGAAHGCHKITAAPYLAPHIAPISGVAHF